MDELVVSEAMEALPDFRFMDHVGHMDAKLKKRFSLLSAGRWTLESLYTFYLESLDAGNLEIALNVVGLLSDDLTVPETGVANRVYLMARARTLANIKGSLTLNAGQAKEAELLLKSVYGISEAEVGALNGGFMSINILPPTAEEVKVIEVIDPDVAEEGE